MKFLMILASFLFSANILATTSYSYDTTIRVGKNSVRCSLLRQRVKFKVSGLDEGRSGRRYFKNNANTAKFEKCSESVAKLKSQLSSVSTVNAKVSKKIEMIYRNVSEGGGRDDDRRDYCKHFQRTTLTLNIPHLTIAGETVRASRYDEVLKYTTVGRCYWR
jgi:hypothetical protein